MINNILFLLFNSLIFAVIYWAWKVDDRIANPSKTKAEDK